MLLDSVLELNKNDDRTVDTAIVDSRYNLQREIEDYICVQRKGHSSALSDPKEAPVEK